MNNHLTISYAHQLDLLSKSIRTEWTWPSPAAGFAAYLARLSGIFVPNGCTIFPLAPNHLTRLNEAPLLAAVGYAFATENCNDDATVQAWKTGIERLGHRNIFTPDHESFVYRPLELLGISLGVAHCPNLASTVRDWLLETLRRAETDLRTGGVFSNVLGAWSASISTEKLNKVHLPTIANLDTTELALSLWVTALHPDLLTDEHQTIDALQSEITKRFAVTQTFETDVARNFLLYSSLRHCVEKMISATGESKIDKVQIIKDKIMLPADLIKSLENHSVTVIAGAGISRAAAGLAGWDDAMKRAIEFLNERGVILKSLDTIEPLLSDGLYEEAAQVVERLLNKINGKADFLRRQFQIETSAIRDRALVEAIWRIAGQVVFTTNYDRLFQLCGPSGVETVTWQDPNKMLAALRGEVSVVHLHGVYNDPDSVVFSASDYTRLSENQAYRNFAQALWTRGPLLFIGASTSGVGDMDFSRLFAWGRKIAPQTPYTSYTLQIKDAIEPEQKQKLYAEYKVEVIEYGSNYSDLRPFLEAFPNAIKEGVG